MNYLSRMLDDGLQNDFWTTAIPIVRYVLFFVIVACAIILIITTLMQANDSDGSLDVISGSQESYYSQNKGSSRDGKLKIITIVMASIIIVCIVLYLLTRFINDFAAG